jgi:hypothetical protein
LNDDSFETADDLASQPGGSLADVNEEDGADENSPGLVAPNVDDE